MLIKNSFFQFFNVNIHFLLKKARPHSGSVIRHEENETKGLVAY